MNLFLYGMTIIGISLACRRFGREQRSVLALGEVCMLWGVVLLVASIFGLDGALLGASLIAGALSIIDARATASGRASVSVGCWRLFARSWWVLGAVCITRLFIVEPFFVPSSSMFPTIARGDILLVNRFAYGLRMPLFGASALLRDAPRHGDVIVFGYPRHPQERLVKRVIGAPGDTVHIQGRDIRVNGMLLTSSPAGRRRYRADDGAAVDAQELVEQIGGRRHFILWEAARPVLDEAEMRTGSNTDVCEREALGALTCTIPAGKYLVLGDNRDRSFDGRYWGFVDDRFVLGKATLVLFNFRSRDHWLKPIE